MRVLRFDTRQPEVTPHWQDYAFDDAPAMTLFVASSEICETRDPSLQFDVVCGSGICGSCAVRVNGRPALACRNLTQDLPASFALGPLPAIELIDDL